MSDASMAAKPFDYDRAFARNIGWVTEAEQRRLRRARVAIAGLGGVGGAHLLAMSRLGIGAFTIADFDRFDYPNFNRQAGAFVSTVGQSKLEVMRRMALDINPQAQVRCLDGGVARENIDEFLHGVDVYADSLDFFTLETRRMVFAACRERGIPALTAAPLGLGVALLCFMPGGMSFEEYFRVEGHPRDEQYARFIAGLSPSMLQRGYLAVPEAVNFREERGPSTVIACELCAGVMTATVMKVLLGRGEVRAAPWGMHFDAYRQRMKFTWRPFGNANPLQQVLLMLIRPHLRGGPSPAAQPGR